MTLTYTIIIIFSLILSILFSLIINKMLSKDYAITKSFIFCIGLTIFLIIIQILDLFVKKFLF